MSPLALPAYALYLRLDAKTQRKVHMDLQRYLVFDEGDEASFRATFLRGIRNWPTFRTLFYYRCAHSGLDKASKVLFKACRVALPPLTSVELGAKSIGGGLRITHHCCVVYAERIGENVGIGPFVVVGAHDHAFPTIEDGVRISANSVVMGGITLGKGCIVGAGSVVNKDVPAGAVVVGSPAHVLRIEDEKSQA